MHIVQIVPHIGSGSGVAGVAFNLQRELTAMGHTVEAFTYATARQGKREKPFPQTKLYRGFRLFRRMVWFTTFGTVRARRFLAARPDAMSICHNNAMVGDIYVNHGVVSAAMRARGNGVWRMMRNPTHIFTFFRDLIRYRSGIHRAIVALSPSEADTLRHVYGRVRPPVEVIPNGVDLEKFRPPTYEERTHARAQFHLDDEARVALFVGHEFERKGLTLAIDALAHAPTVLLLAVGGNASSIDDARARAERLSVAERVLFVGPRFDLPLFFAASDIFVLPSAYEANALVILEALASGLPVVATAVGYAPEIIENGLNGFIVERDPAEIGDVLETLADHEPEHWREACRAAAQRSGWRRTAEQYIDLLDRLQTAAAPRHEQVIR
ncbi:glycosyltransferase [Microbacterium lacus]|uniref:glycosyltransferase n=1 Tax=Microbacterium lacus TaxID=415217 RepID=UPI00384BD3DF